jgi:hypothetical protein
LLVSIFDIGNLIGQLLKFNVLLLIPISTALISLVIIFLQGFLLKNIGGYAALYLILGTRLLKGFLYGL